jgi:plasmid stabilization system protein ParE
LDYYFSQEVPVEVVAAWLRGLYGKVECLYDMPRRIPVAHWMTKAKGYEIRRMNYGEYALLCRVREDERLVEIIAFRHGRRRPWHEEQESGRVEE